MVTEEDLAEQFNVIIEHAHPHIWTLLRHCYVKVINPNPYLTRGCGSGGRYICIYCPDKLLTTVLSQKNLLREVAEYVGLVEVVCLNANNLMRDRLSNLKQTYPHLWLDLLWIVTQ